MAKVQKTVITALGEQMLFSSALTYTDATLCSQDVSNLTTDQLRALTDLTGKVLSSPISAHKRQGNTKADQVDVQVTFTNRDQKTDINYSSIGWFARDRQGHETLIAVTPFIGTDTIAAAPPDGTATSSKNITLSMAVGTATEINVLIDPAGSVTPSTFNAEVDKINEALALKADNAELADYAKKADVNSALDAKADKTALDPLAKSEDVAKDVETLNSAINLKADKTDLAPLAKTEDVNTELDKKADKTALDDYAKSSDVAADVKQLTDSIATKADAKTVDDAIDKIDFTPYAKKADVQAELDTKANTTDLAPFARSVDVNKQIEGVSTAVTNASNTEQADIDKINKVLATKRDITDSYSKDQLDKKFLELSTDTGGKVDASQVATMIENKADKSDVTKQIGTITDLVNTKANSTDVDAALDKKDDTTDVDAKIKIVTDLANTKANSSDVYTKSAVDTAFSQRDSRIANVTNLANQIDSTRLPLYQGSANEDLKGFFTPQIRMYNNATGVKNIPADCQYQSNFYGTLVVLPDGASNTNDGSQILITPERKAWIAQSNGQGAKSWSDWSRFTLTSDLSAVQSALQAKIDAKADASNVYSKSEVDSKTTATIVTGYDIPSKTRQTISAGVNVRWLVDPSVIDIVADQINQLKGRRTIDNPDFNSLTDGGSYYITNPQGGKNSPTGSWGNLFVSNGNGHRISQLYFPDDGSALFMRELDESTWHNWIQLSTTAQTGNAQTTANQAKDLATQANNGLAGKADKSQVNVATTLYRMIGDSDTWQKIFGADNNDTAVLTSLRLQGGTGPLLGNFAAGVGFGGADTKGVLQVAYSDHQARITGGNGSTPVWSEDIAWKSDISSLTQALTKLQAAFDAQQTKIAALQATVNNQANQLTYFKQHYIEGKAFDADQIKQAMAWTGDDGQKLAIIKDKENEGGK